MSIGWRSALRDRCSRRSAHGSERVCSWCVCLPCKGPQISCCCRMQSQQMGRGGPCCIGGCEGSRVPVGARARVRIEAASSIAVIRRSGPGFVAKRSGVACCGGLRLEVERRTSSKTASHRPLTAIQSIRRDTDWGEGQMVERRQSLQIPRNSRWWSCTLPAWLHCSMRNAPLFFSAVAELVLIGSG